MIRRAGRIRGNHTGIADDYLSVDGAMSCADCRDGVSARLDEEKPGVDPARLDEHLGACADCRAWLGEALRVTRAVRLQRVDDVPDLTAAVLERVRGEARTKRRGAWLATARVALFAVAAAQCAAGLAVVFEPSVLGALPVHGAHELGAFNVAVGVAFAWSAWRPGRARAQLPLLATLVVVLAALTGRDVLAGHTAVVAEGGHLLLLAGLALTAALARYRVEGVPPPSGASAGAPDELPRSDSSLDWPLALRRGAGGSRSADASVRDQRRGPGREGGEDRQSRESRDARKGRAA